MRVLYPWLLHAYCPCSSPSNEDGAVKRSQAQPVAPQVSLQTHILPSHKETLPCSPPHLHMQLLPPVPVSLTGTPCDQNVPEKDKSRQDKTVWGRPPSSTSMPCQVAHTHTLSDISMLPRPSTLYEPSRSPEQFCHYVLPWCNRMPCQVDGHTSLQGDAWPFTWQGTLLHHGRSRSQEMVMVVTCEVP